MSRRPEQRSVKSEAGAPQPRTRRRKVSDERRRVVIESVRPSVDGGRFPVKRTVGERVRVEADAFADGHDVLVCVLLHRRKGSRTWDESPMRALGNDRFAGEFVVDELGRFEYSVTGWVDRLATWRRDLEKKVDAEQDVSIDLLVGAGLVQDAADRAKGADAKALRAHVRAISGAESPSEASALALDGELGELAARYADRSHATTSEQVLEVVVDRELARFSTWYELFPRSCSTVPGRHGTFADCEARLPYVAELGFDVLYLPPIHPIGRTKRKGRNNAVTAAPADPGSPWAIGASDGGHKSIHPDLGSLADFRKLVASARSHGIEVALDIAFQCSPDHPYVQEHPEWFRWRPDGTVQFAENPPKRYEDIYPFEFDTDAWRELWHELRSVFEFWIEQGVTVFRVDNPHTKPFPFWEWCIRELKEAHPELILLSEAFTRPKVMHRLAKLGYTQSYTYFAWRNTKQELTDYFTELARGDAREYFRPNAWPNTPDILTEYLQFGGRPAFVTRLVLAATLAASYGIYGPAFELCEHRPREPGSEEYLDSEKYEIRFWDLDRPDSLRQLVARVNAIRRENPALQQDWTLTFHQIDGDQLICYSKTDGLDDAILVVVNLDPHHTHGGWVDLSLDTLGLDERPFQVHDLLGGGRFVWQGSRNYVELDPQVLPAHVFRVRRQLRTEKEFDYFL